MRDGDTEEQSWRSQRQKGRGSLWEEIYGCSKRGQEVSWCEGKRMRRAGLDGARGSTVATSEENKESRRELMLQIYSPAPLREKPPGRLNVNI